MSTVVTGIETDDSWNTVPAEIRIEVDVRTLIGQTLDDVYEHLRLALGELAATVEISAVAGSDGSSSPTGTALWQLMTDSARVQVPGAQLRPIMASGITDARFYRHRGATAYGFGLYSARLPVEEIPTMLHGDDERVDVESIHMMGELWSTMFGLFAERTAR
jgi:acetylornithine deacetylase/succinyl-diaminopimelate desuccinylase-like protein